MEEIWDIHKFLSKNMKSLPTVPIFHLVNNYISLNFYCVLCCTSVICLLSCSVTKSCPSLCHPMDCSMPGFSVHGGFQARVLKRVAISSSRILSRPQINPMSLALVGRFSASEPPGKTMSIIHSSYSD